MRSSGSFLHERPPARKQNSITKEGDGMREEYDFSNAIKNPYAQKLKAEKQQITMNMNTSTITYFKDMSARTNIPYQNLINLYLDECVKDRKTLKFV